MTKKSLAHFLLAMALSLAAVASMNQGAAAEISRPKLPSCRELQKILIMPTACPRGTFNKCNETQACRLKAGKVGQVCVKRTPCVPRL